MVIVVADDFTGSAEIAGVGLRYSLRSKIFLNDEIFNFAGGERFRKEDLDLIVISTDTRIMSEFESYNFIYHLTKQLRGLGGSFIYKKVDSILRGNVYQELRAMMDAYPFEKIILIPANPGLGRVIKDGFYMVNGQYIHQTSLAQDPDFFAKSSSVIEMLKAQGKKDVVILKPGQSLENLEKPCIILGEAVSDSDLKLWVEKIDKDTLPAGGVEFFKSIIESFSERFFLSGSVEKGVASNILNGVTLFVCGSAISQSKVLQNILAEFNLQVLSMPDDVFYDTESSNLKFEEWVESVKQYLSLYKFAAVAINNKPIIKDRNFTKKLRQKLVDLTLQVFEGIKVNELFIEGGSTAHSILKNLGLKEFEPLDELAPGVIRMRPQNFSDLYITVKPGSYNWPEQLLDLLLIKLKSGLSCL